MSEPETRTAAVVLAAGSGTRVGGTVNKVLLPLHGLPVLVRSVVTALDVPGLHRIVVVVRPEDRPDVRRLLAPHLGPHDVWILDGGATRHESEWRALQALAPDIEDDEIDVVAIHDAARPLATAALWTAVIEAAHARGAAIPVVRMPRLSHRSGVLAAPGLVGVQTPQAFRASALLAAHRRAELDDFAGTDTAAVLARSADIDIVGVDSGPENLKVTFPEDLAQAEALLR